MLVCPKCQFENPNTNKFCQNCGTSLTHKICVCGSQVVFTEELCHNCGINNGKVWWAIISQDSNLSLSGAELATESPSAPMISSTITDLPEIPDLSTDNSSPEIDALTDHNLPTITNDEEDLRAEEITPEEPDVSISVDTIPVSEILEEDSITQQETVSPLLTREYLDQQYRYKLRFPFQPCGNDTKEQKLFCTTVLDCQPFQQTILNVLSNPQSQSSEKQSEAMGIPSIAQTYLALEQKLGEVIPKIHDAWQQHGEIILLLEDRDPWSRLKDLWQNEEISILQILYWLGEIVKLWGELTPFNCRSSLLQISNILVDEDQKISLRQLYLETTDSPPHLQDLGELCQSLFTDSHRTQFNSLSQLFKELCDGDITDIIELRSRLKAISEELQPKEVEKSAEEAFTAHNTLSTEAALLLTEAELEEDNDSDDQTTVILPMQLLSLEDAGFTDIGRQRNHNEDCFGIETKLNKQETPIGRTVQACGLYILCDGMGGHDGGEVASALAVETLRRYFQENWQNTLPSEDSIRTAILQANKAIYDINQQNARSGSGRMGTTLVMALIQDTKMAIAHVGDSRLYCLSRKRGLEQMTVDHEVGQREIQRGVEANIAYARPDALQLTQALGPRDEHFVNPDIQFFDLNEDTLLLLCSDGLSDYDLLETYWQSHLLPLLSYRANLEQGVQQLIDLGNQHNGHDNITAVLVRAKIRPNLQSQKSDL